MKVQEFGLIVLWMADRDDIENDVLGDFCYHFRNSIEDVSEEGCLLESKK